MERNTVAPLKVGWKSKTMELLKAQTIAEGIVSQLKPYCSRILIAGSIRRKRPLVHDIDIVLVPENQGKLIYKITQLMGAPRIAGEKLITCQLADINVDLYIATPGTWATILLIRTGSAAHNIKLASLAKKKGMMLHADGRGVTKEGVIKSGDTEQSIFEALDLPYLEPEAREC